MVKDNVLPTQKWEFNEEVTKCFDDMLERSIPEYGLMRDLVTKIGFRYVQKGTAIIDLGCSNGNAIQPFVSRFGASNTYKLYDVSEPMLEACKEKYSDMIRAGFVEVENKDITKGFPNVDTSLVLGILTLQFTPIEYRQKIVKDVFDLLEPGGAFILVEKVLGNTYDLDSMFVKEYYGMKSEHQYTEAQIASKRKSLEGVLVPITANWNESLLKDSGFSDVDCFWRCLNFAGWVAVKKPHEKQKAINELHARGLL